MNRDKLYLILCAAILMGLFSYSAVVGPEHMDSLPKALAQPDRMVGSELRLPLSVKVVQVHPQEFVVQQHGIQLSVRVPADIEQKWVVWKQPLQVGDSVSLRATLQPEGYLLLHDMHIHRGRQLKIWVSILALFLLAGILIHERIKAFPRSCPTSSLT